MLLKLENINKVFKTIHRREGLFGIFKDIFKPNYLNTVALKNINIEINKGDRIGIVGRNGSGKSTLIKILSAILKPTEGQISYLNMDPWKHPKTYKKKIGVLFGQKSQLSYELAFQESIELLRLIYDLSKSEAKERMDYLTDRLRLHDLLKKQVREMSLGQRMRCEIASIFLHKPDIIFLDEPTIGLDLEIKDILYDIINNMCTEDEMTLIITSHDVQDIRLLSKKLLLIESGEIILDTYTEDFINKYKLHKKIEVTLNKEIDKTELNFKTGRNINILDIRKNIITLIVDKNISIPNFFSLLNLDINNIIDIKIIENDFSDILLDFYKNN